ncbi:MAG TPA: universal stress protein [Vicinamibacteria bacterium]|nr:universal stress protein [Vicinamibacteria bacterium]
MKVLVCLDRDPLYEALLSALTWCLPLSARDHVLVGHAIAPLRWMPGWAETERDIFERVDDFLAQTAERIEQAGIPAEPLRLEGDVATELLKAAEDRDVDLVALGAVGQARSQDFLVGSVSEKVASLVPRDVLLVRAAEPRAGGGFRALLAVDGSDASLEAVESFAVKTRASEAVIEVLHVIEAPPLTWDMDPDLTGEPPVSDPPALRERADHALARSTETLAARGLTAKTTLRRGMATAEILDEARTFEADLIVLGARGVQSRLPKPWRGTVARRVARHADCSVLIAAPA